MRTAAVDQRDPGVTAPDQVADDLISSRNIVGIHAGNRLVLGLSDSHETDIRLAQHVGQLCGIVEARQYGAFPGEDRPDDRFHVLV